ncbi:dhaK [Symbiodinium microadriaticum]|nr:dhaK [Symbiodinium microadriaticum]
MAEKRVDPEDGYKYTYDEMFAHYMKQGYRRKDIDIYWEQKMYSTRKPKGPKAPAEPKAKAKVKAKAKPEGKQRARGPANPKRFVNEEATIVQDGIVSSGATCNYGEFEKYEIPNWFMRFPALSLAQGQNGDYQKYMSQYASQYQNYMQGASGNGGDGYQKYYKKYMAQYGSDSAGGYDKYMSKYAGDYASKYMPSESSGSTDESSRDGKKPVSFIAAEAENMVSLYTTPRGARSMAFADPSSEESSLRGEPLLRDTADRDATSAQITCVLQQAVGGLTSPRGGGKYEQELLSALQQLLEKFGPSPGGKDKGEGKQGMYSFTIPEAHQSEHAADKSGSQGADYKQYMDYSKYTQGHGSQGSDYKQYMQSYGGDYSKYTQGHGSQGGDYKQFMDYSKYTQGHGSQGSDYKQYMQSYGGDYSKYTQGHGSQGGDYKQFMDYSKYTQGHGSQGSDYKQYMQSYADDYSKYTQGHGSEKSGFQKYMDYSKYTKGQGASDAALMLAATGPNASSEHEREKQQEQRERQREAHERQQEDEREEREKQRESHLRQQEHLRHELAAEAKDHQSTEEAKESKLREEEKQHLHEELAQERERLSKELAEEKEKLRQELAAERKEEQEEQAKEQKEEQAPATQLAGIPATQCILKSPMLLAAGGLSLGAFAAAAAFAIRLRRQSQVQSDGADDYLLHLDVAFLSEFSPHALARAECLRIRLRAGEFWRREVDCIDGLIWSTPNLGRLDGYPDVKVVYRTDWNKDKVAVLCGGGAGHEPMHGGFVGRGMLTAAISGETFASPSIDAVLAAIVQVTGPKGCLLIIKNYTGDRLNFSLAAQRARSIYGLEVETVITKDDVATTAERGIAGTLFVHKVAGAMSEEGKSLSEIKTKAEEIITQTVSLGVSFSVVRRLKAESIGLGKMEVGLGIHGEPGARTEPRADAKKVMEVLLEGLEAGRVARQLPAPEEGVICLVNNLGGVPPQEMCILVADLMRSKWGPSVKLLIGPGLLCTSLDMNGVSISLLPWSAAMAKLIQEPTAAAAWPAAVVPEFPTPAAIAVRDCFEGVTPSSDEQVKSILEKVCKALIGAKEKLDDLDSKVGDADCGSTMAKAASSVLADQERLPLADPKALCGCLSDILGRTGGVWGLGFRVALSSLRPLQTLFVLC